VITRLKIDGFKNLVGVDVSFGPFTCIAGPNGVGKSNIFDAIQFLSALADVSLIAAASGVRGDAGGAFATDIFTRTAHGPSKEMSFLVEMIVPDQVMDDYDQVVRPTSRHLRYELSVQHQTEPSEKVPRLLITKESLTHLNKSDAGERLPWARTCKTWLTSTFTEKSRSSAYISTEEREGAVFFKLHEDSGHQGRTLARGSSPTPRTALSSVNTKEYPTVMAAKRELQSWRILQLEPSKLRQPSEWNEPSSLGRDGSHLAATAQRILNSREELESGAVAARLSSRLFGLIGEVKMIGVDEDEVRRTYTVVASGTDGIRYRARELSDGTLRFLALAVLERDPAWSGLVCMEEPENGIHPLRIPAILDLLRSIALDPKYPLGKDNPLRQVILSTHSPLVVDRIPEDSLVMVLPWKVEMEDGAWVPCASYRSLEYTWRARAGAAVIPKGEILSYLGTMQPDLRKMPKEEMLVGQREDILEGLGLFMAAEEPAG